MQQYCAKTKLTLCQRDAKGYARIAAKYGNRQNHLEVFLLLLDIAEMRKGLTVP